MADLLVKLYDLPDAEKAVADLGREGIAIRPARPTERDLVLAWVEGDFGERWARECAVAFAGGLVTCHVALEGGDIVGFACYDASFRGVFGPMGVAERARSRGIGRGLLLSCLAAMEVLGYAYAVVGCVGPVEFYRKTARAAEIPGSTPGAYRGRPWSRRA